MTEVFINPLSANRQSYAREDVERLVEEIVACFGYVRPALEHGRIQIIYDDLIEQRSLTQDSTSLLGDLNLIKNRDLVRQWFLFVKNRANRNLSDPWSVAIYGVSVETDGVTGDVRKDAVVNDARWLSFGGTPLNQRSELSVLPTHLEVATAVNNASDVTSFRMWWPRYERSPKHKHEGYWRAGGEWVSPMPLDDDTAQEILLTSVVSGNDRFAIYRSQYFQFARTYSKSEIFHGFSVDPGDVPGSIIAQLRQHRV
jgi:hypothetical protein